MRPSWGARSPREGNSTRFQRKGEWGAQDSHDMAPCHVVNCELPAPVKHSLSNLTLNLTHFKDWVYIPLARDNFNEINMTEQTAYYVYWKDCKSTASLLVGPCFNARLREFLYEPWRMIFCACPENTIPFRSLAVLASLSSSLLFPLLPLSFRDFFG